MAASGVGRTLQAVKPHIPMIRFKSPGFMAVTAPVASPGESHQSQTIQVHTPQTESTGSTLAASYVKPVGTIPRGSGISDKDLPQKYRRKLIEEDEIAYILRGGPE